MLIKIEGFILSETPYGDNSKIIHVLTKEYGLIGIMCKGVKGIKNKNRVATLKYSYSLFNIYYKENKLSLLSSADVINPLKNIRTDITLISYITYLSELTSQVLKQNPSKNIYDDFGELLFTHFGVSGPTILSSSAHIIRYKEIDRLLRIGKVVLKIDLKPALDREKLDNRILRDFEKDRNKLFKNSLGDLLPKKLINPVIRLSGINPDKKVNEISKEERLQLLKILKEFCITISGFRPVEEAIITAGGINIKEINPKTMESKIIKNLFFAGEIIDVDAYTGGFNLQIAYSTGYTAGMNN